MSDTVVTPPGKCDGDRGKFTREVSCTDPVSDIRFVLILENKYKYLVSETSYICISPKNFETWVRELLICILQNNSQDLASGSSNHLDALYDLFFVTVVLSL